VEDLAASKQWNGSAWVGAALTVPTMTLDDDDQWTYDFDGGSAGSAYWVNIPADDELPSVNAAAFSISIPAALPEPDMIYYVDYDAIDDEIVDLTGLIPAKVVALNEEVAWVRKHIRNAQRVIDARIGKIVSLPFASVDVVPGVIKDLTLLLSCYRILRPNYVKEDPAVSDWVDTYKSDFDSILNDLLDGNVTIIDDTGTVTSDTGIASNTSSTAREFRQTTYDDNGVIIDSGNMETW
jgi:hypothetical protein